MLRPESPSTTKETATIQWLTRSRAVKRRMLRPERPASIRLRPETRKNSASTATMPTTAAAPIQNSQRLRKTRQSRPSGWISTEAAAIRDGDAAVDEAAAAGRVAAPSPRPRCRRARCWAAARRSAPSASGGPARGSAPACRRRSAPAARWFPAPGCSRRRARCRPRAPRTAPPGRRRPARPAGPAAPPKARPAATASARARSSGPPARRASVVVQAHMVTVSL